MHLFTGKCSSEYDIPAAEIDALLGFSPDVNSVNTSSVPATLKRSNTLDKQTITNYNVGNYLLFDMELVSWTHVII